MHVSNYRFVRFPVIDQVYELNRIKNQFSEFKAPKNRMSSRKLNIDSVELKRSKIDCMETQNHISIIK